jgi:hypothetical protein
VTQALDPLRLLDQLQQLQKALWRHAIKLGAPAESLVPGAPLPFSVQQCAGHELPEEGITAPPPSSTRNRRAAESTKKVGDLVIGARGRIPSRAAGSKLRLGCVRIQNEQGFPSSKNCVSSILTAGDPPSNGPCSAVSRRSVLTCS